MSENIYGMLKRRFPIIRQLRFHLEKSQQVILSAAILHNICIEWGDHLPPAEEPDGQDDGDHDPAPVPENRDQRILLRGQQERAQMMAQMPPATSGERRRMRVDRM